MGTAAFVDALIELKRCAAACLAADQCVDHADVDAQREYADEQLTLAARELTRATNNLPLHEQPVGWREHAGVEPSWPLDPWLMPCRAQLDAAGHRHECATKGDIGHRWHYCACGYDWEQAPSKCCDGTGYADHAAVPCRAPDCPVMVKP